MPVGTNKIRRGRAAIALLLLVMPALVLLGCSTQKNYKVLSFFFDGVPDPNAPQPVLVSQTSGNGPGASGPVEARKYQHQPYAEKKCAACHTADQKHLTSLSAPELCLKCHTNVVNRYAVMHGPVSVGQCLWCHEAHASNQEHLLKSTGAELCLQCHDRHLLPDDTPGHRAEEAICLDCHTGHGSDQPSLLRAQTPTVAPPHPPGVATTQPGGGVP